MGRVFILALLTLVLAGAAAKDNLAILPFTGGEGDEGETIAELFSFEPELTRVFKPVPRTSITRAIEREQRFQESGLTDPDTVASLGRQVGAQYVVSGSITAVGNQKALIIDILKIEDLRQIAGELLTYTHIEDIQDQLPSMARKIVAASRKDASQLPKLAVSSVELSGRTDPQAADTLARVLAGHIIRNESYAVYPRTASLEDILREFDHQSSGDTAEEELVALGQGDNPELVLAVKARRLGNRNMFNAVLLNLITGAQEAGASANYQSLEDGIFAIEKLAAALSGKGWERSVSSVADFTQAIVAINADTGGGDYFITLNSDLAAASITFTGNVGKRIILKGDGPGRTITNNGNTPIFTVPVHITLVLEANLVLNGGNREAFLVRVEGGNLLMQIGSTLRNAKSSGVFIDHGSFVMEGGLISGNTTSSGGGVMVGNGSFTMKGGTISGNRATSGGGVMVGNGSFVMEGGLISENRASSGGGGVVVSRGSFTMEGGTITGNTSSYGGGGVFVGNGGFTMEGGRISGNTTNYDGGGVFVSQSGDNSFTKHGGTIDTDNTAKSGKAVYVSIEDRTARIRNSAAGPGDNLDSSVAGHTGGWE